MNLVFDRGNTWQTAVTEFDLVCDREWLNALITSLGLASLLFAAFLAGFQLFSTFMRRENHQSVFMNFKPRIAGIYIERFGRKNAILVWITVEAAVMCEVVH